MDEVSGYDNDMLETKIGYSKLNSLEQGVLFNVYKINAPGVISNTNTGILTYTNTVSNIGNGMDIGTGKFTVPVLGYYNFEFTATGAFTNLEKPVDIYVMVNNRYRFTIFDTSNQPGVNFGYSWQFHLQKGDQIWIKFKPVADGVGTRGIHSSDRYFPAIFKGQLVQEDVF